jgi:hypothetical protein
MPSATANAPTLPMNCPYVFGVVATEQSFRETYGEGCCHAAYRLSQATG